MQVGPYIVPPESPHSGGDEGYQRRDDHDVVPARPHHESNLARDVNSGMMPIPMKTSGVAASAAFVALALLSSSVAVAAPAKKYHFELTAVTPKPEVNADVAAYAKERVQAEVGKQFDKHPQLVGTLDGAPDPRTSAEPYRKYLIKKGISGSYLVTVEITEASEQISPMEGKPNTQRLSVHLAIHVLGETIPGRTMGFSGDGQATIKQEIGMKLRDKDRVFVWDGVTESAVQGALDQAFKKLAAGHAKP